MTINIDQSDKDRLSPVSTRSTRTTKQDWYLFRNEAIKKAEAVANSRDVLLKFILVVLVKIYWELRKPRGSYDRSN